MATKSSNTQGNPYHDEEGKFTSANDTGGAKPEQASSKPYVKIISSPISAKPTIKLKEGRSLQELANRLNDINQVANIPRLNSARDIENNIENYFSRQVVTKIDELYGKDTNIASYQYHPKANPRKTLEIFPNVLAKYRYKDNHAHYISGEEYMRNPNRFTLIYRGMSSTGNKAKGILDSYVDASLGALDHLCPNGDNCHGSNVYTSIYRSTASSYAGYNGTIIHGLLDENSSYYLGENQIARIQNNINYDNLENRIQQKVLSYGIVDSNRAQRIAHSFCQALKNDVGMCAILLGCDFFVAGSLGGEQRNLLNLNKWYIRKDL